MTRIRWIAATALLSAFAASAAPVETTIYKSIDREGALTYSSEGAAPGAAEVDVMHIFTTPAAAAQHNVLVEATAAELERDRIVRERALRRADESVARAQRDLERSKADLEAGRAIRADEWIGNVNGTERPRQSYVDRVAALEQRVDRARARLDRAYEERNLLR